MKFRVFLAALLLSSIAAFPLESPCLQSCVNEEITNTILQKCNDQCLTLNHCCGNRLNGESPDSAAERLSCANGCEIAFYRSTVEECKSDCADGNQNGCEYQHPNIPSLFSKCGDCQAGCDKWPDASACSDGCDFAAQFEEYYQYVEKPEGTCEQDNIPRFLFAGQSNMVRFQEKSCVTKTILLIQSLYLTMIHIISHHTSKEGVSEQALPNSFTKMIKIVNSKKSKKNIKNRLRKLLIQGEASEEQTAKNEARFLYAMRKHLKKKFMFKNHRTSTCSFTMPNREPNNLDCERPVSSTACGSEHSMYGPEFSFSHVFPTLTSPLQGEAISITKVAVGGTPISQWLKENRDNDDNYWYGLVDAIKGAQGTLEAFVWFQGENDLFLEDGPNLSYQEQLTQFVADVRQEMYDMSGDKFESPADIPVIIVELGRWIWGLGSEIIDAQRAFVASDSNAVLVPTGAGDNRDEKMTAFYHYDIASILIIGKRIADAMATILNENTRKTTRNGTTIETIFA